jgi:adenylate cyclase
MSGEAVSTAPDLGPTTAGHQPTRWAVPAGLRRLIDIGVEADDSDEDRLQKATLTLAATLMASMATVWVATYWSLDLWRSGAIPFAYQIATVIGLGVFARTKRFTPFCRGQLLMMLALPVLLQASLGGFRVSSAVALWSVTAPLGALLLEGVRRATPWFIAFAAAIAVLALLEPHLTGEGHVPTPIVVTFFFLNVMGVSTTVFLLLRYFISERDRVAEELRIEQDRSERLLLNVLPVSIAERLKKGPNVIADAYDQVTVLFADVVGFTTFADARPPAEVVAVLNRLFSAFDELADRHGLEKIKTIGDAYMAVGGLPMASAGHQQAVAEMALDLRDSVDRLRTETGVDLAVRVGIDSGPVVAGVIGQRKFSYDVWGDTVNMASRMESHGIPGCIQVTAAVREHLQEDYLFEERQAVDIKGKGPTTTYLLLGRQTGLVA